MPRANTHKPKRAATLADVGRVAGVSAMAASAVLNGARTSSRISDLTRARIERAALKLSYRPNAAARALANRRMDTIGVAAVIDGGELNHYFLEVFNGILEMAAKHEQNTTVFALHDWTRDTARLPRLCDGRIDGMILLAPTFHKQPPNLPAHTPFVSIHSNLALPNVVNIESDEERGAYEMVRHLLAQGHRRILYLAGPEDLLGPTRRIRGYKRALASCRVAFDPKLLVHGGFSTDEGRHEMRAWLRKHTGEPLPHAVFGVNDAVAFGALEALAEAGLRVPDDISVAGFDDSLAARTAVPQLTTVRQPLRTMGVRAVEVLLKRIAHHAGDGPDVSDATIVFPVDLAPRASVGLPPAVPRQVPSVR